MMNQSSSAQANRKELFQKAFPFWEKLSEEEQNEFVTGSQYTVYEKGVVMHRSEQSCKGMMLLLSGQLRTYIVSEAGREVTLYRVRAGDVCVMSSSCLMDAIVFDVLIEAIERTEAIAIPSSVLARVIQNVPEAELYLYKTASERFSDIMWTMQQILFMGADQRVAIFLWDEYVKNGEEIRFTHEEIARLIGSAREVISKVLKYFAEEGIVALTRGKIRILDKERLRALT